MEPADLDRAVVAARSIATELGLPAQEAIVLQDSNKLALRLLPCDTFARVAPVEHQHARFEVLLALRLAEVASPVAALDPRVAAHGYERDGFEVTFWTHYGAVSAAVATDAYADGLARLHAGLRTIDVPTPHFTDRVAEAELIVAGRDDTPDLPEPDRALLADTLARVRAVIQDRGAPEQLLHGEPHASNVLDTADGPVFIDLETCCRGPVEFDLAHAPEAVIEHYPGVDRALLDACRELVLAMVAAWRWEPGDQLPRGHDFGQALLGTLRAGPPWPTIDVVYDRLDAP